MIVISRRNRRPNESSSSSAGSFVPVSTPGQQMREMSRKRATGSSDFLFTRRELSLSPRTTQTEAHTLSPQPSTTTMSPAASRTALSSRFKTTEAHGRREVRESAPTRSSDLMFPLEDVPSAARVRLADVQTQASRSQEKITTQAAAQASHRGDTAQRPQDPSPSETTAQLGPATRDAPAQLASAENPPRRLQARQRSSLEVSSSTRQPEASSSSQRTEASPSLPLAEALPPYALSMRERETGPNRIPRTLREISLDRQNLPAYSQRGTGSQPGTQDPSAEGRRVDVNRPGY